ncbi:hypothetical protein D3P07_16020 [Paenibacillus sp. 1011MAR3C5]|uniref:hypothetical protein n=1 Tax=Paenibacillus sp. 1011MAR3C5 TaxID=1675787 RepID=UPI000E6CAE87|nr:hypothetical protein [Paenibacillus sp. 1011MAR3C5]RJE86696.1 hypothetical protein D3P07_16020 [Paenibacillus sp. 1011MAR3C5]
MKILKFIAIGLIFLMNIGCSGKQTIQNPSYTFTAKLISVVSHKGDLIDGIPIVYTIQVQDFDPSEVEFQKYNSQFVQNGEFKHIHLTKQTRIHNHDGEQIEAEEMEIDRIITFTVQLSNDGYNLLATDITV